MHKIEIDDEIFALLQQLAVPFVDTPNSVLRRELLTAQKDSPSRRLMRQPHNSLLYCTTGPAS